MPVVVVWAAPPVSPPPQEKGTHPMFSPHTAHVLHLVAWGLGVLDVAIVAISLIGAK